jgi:hypothetical protein
MFWFSCRLTVLPVDLTDDRGDLFDLHLNVWLEDSLPDAFHVRGETITPYNTNKTIVHRIRFDTIFISSLISPFQDRMPGKADPAQHLPLTHHPTTITKSLTKPTLAKPYHAYQPPSNPLLPNT